MPWPKGLPRRGPNDTAEAARARLAAEKAEEKARLQAATARRFGRPVKPPKVPAEERFMMALSDLMALREGVGAKGLAYIDDEIKKAEDRIAFLRSCRVMLSLGAASPPAPKPAAVVGAHLNGPPFDGAEARRG